MEVFLVGVFEPFSTGIAGPSPGWSDSRVLSLERLLTLPFFGGRNILGVRHVAAGGSMEIRRALTS